MNQTGIQIDRLKKKYFNQKIQKNFFFNIGRFIHQNVLSQMLINFKNKCWSPDLSKKMYLRKTVL